MMRIQWKDGCPDPELLGAITRVRVDAGCGGEVEIIYGEGYICTGCGELSFSDTPSDEERERREQADEKASELEREEWRNREWEEYRREHPEE